MLTCVIYSEGTQILNAVKKLYAPLWREQFMSTHLLQFPADGDLHPDYFVCALYLKSF